MMHEITCQPDPDLGCTLIEDEDGRTLGVQDLARAYVGAMKGEPGDPGRDLGAGAPTSQTLSPPPGGTPNGAAGD